MKLVKPVVVNRHKEPFDVYIGRGTLFGNPYKIDLSQGISRTVAIEMFRKYIYDSLENGSIKIEDILALSSKKLGCSCKPLPCHGDIIVEVFEEIMNMNKED